MRMLLPLLLAVAVPPSQPDPSELERTHVLRVDLARESGHWLWNGKQRPVFALEGEQRLERRLVVRDRLDERRPSRVASRHFEEARYSDPFEQRAGAADFESPCAGRVLSFEYDESGELHAARFDEQRAGDAQLLEGLDHDLDGRGLWPENAPDPASSWSPPAAALARALFAGGDLGFGLGRAPEDFEGVPQDSSAHLVQPVLPTRLADWAGVLQGSVTATRTGERELDGRTCQVVELAYELGGELDGRAFLEARCAGRNRFDQAPLAITLDGRGELLWDAEAGRIAALECEADLAIDFQARWRVDVRDSDRGMTLDWGEVYRGSLRSSLTVGPP